MDEAGKKQASPFFASTSWDPKDDSEESTRIFLERFFKLDRRFRLGLISEEASQAIENLSEKLGIIEPKAVGEISRIVRNVFLEKISKTEIEKRIAERKLVPAEKKEALMEGIKEIVFLVKKIGQERHDEYFEELSIIPAMNKHRNLAEQEITNWYLADEQGEERIQPTVKAWIDDYIKTKGAQGHTDLERSDYLFNARNTKGLKPEERRRLSAVLASYDQDRPLEIYLTENAPEIYFDNSSGEEKNWMAKPEPGVRKPSASGVGLGLDSMVLPSSIRSTGNQPKFVSSQQNVRFSQLPEVFQEEDGSTVKIETSQQADFEKVERGHRDEMQKKLDTRLAVISPSMKLGSGIRPSANLVDLTKGK